jgi:nicotinate-nucleotide adenylyltransferase
MSAFAGLAAGDRIGLLGGTFDPIHHGHLRLAQLARRQRRLRRVYFQPALRPVHRSHPPVAELSHRVAMLALALQPERGFHLLAAEFAARPGRPTYTVEVLRAVHEALPAGVAVDFLLGADAFIELETWHRWRQLTRFATLVVADRPRIGATARVQRILSRLDQQVSWLEGVRSPVSATAVRQRVARGRRLAGWVPAAVERYILRNGLYGPPPKGGR